MKCLFCDSKMESRGARFGSNSQQTFVCPKCKRVMVEVYAGRRGLQLNFLESQGDEVFAYLNKEWLPHVNARYGLACRHEEKEIEALKEQIGAAAYSPTLEKEYNKRKSFYDSLDGAVIPLPPEIASHAPPHGIEKLIESGVRVKVYDSISREWVEYSGSVPKLVNPVYTEEWERAQKIGKILGAIPVEIKNEYDGDSPFPWFKYKVGEHELVYGYRHSVWEIRASVGSKSVKVLADSCEATVAKDGGFVHAWKERELYEYCALYGVAFSMPKEK